jgi:hypothetical protein
VNAAIEPWLWPDDMQHVVVDEAEQARALLASFRAFVPQDFFVGFFVWRYYADLDDTSQEAIWGFSPHGKRAEAVLERVFAQRFGVEPEPYGWIDDALDPPTWADALMTTRPFWSSTVVPR